MKWEVQEAASSCYHVYAWVDGAVDGLKKHFGKGLSRHIYIGKDAMGYEYFDSKELITVGNYIIEKFKDKKVRDYVVTEFEKYKIELTKLYHEVIASNISNISIPELKFIFKKYIDTFYGFYNLTMFPEVVEPAIDNFFAGKLKDLSIITTPPTLSFIQKEKLSLLKIMSKHKKITKNLFKDHVEQFAWLRVNYNDPTKLSIEDVMERVKELKNNVKEEINKLENFEEEIKEKKKALTKNLPKVLQDLIIISDFTGWLHDERKELVLKWLYYFSQILTEIAHRNSITYDQIKYLPIHKIKDILDGIYMNKKTIDEYRVCYVYERSNKGSIEYYGIAGLDFEKKYFSKKTEQETTTLQGMAVSTGVAEGKAKIVYLKKDFAKFNKGDILVAPMTRPEFVPLMRKAAAIVTDQGGITSHASIISRELGKPCIVGTKVATKVIKDNQIIEVNANHGVVKLK